MNLGHFKNTYFHFQKFIELNPVDGCAICDFNKREFKDQKDLYIEFFKSQRLVLSVIKEGEVYHPIIIFKGTTENMRVYNTEEQAYRSGVKKSFEILNANLII